jgi:hypothetical protein
VLTAVKLILSAMGREIWMFGWLKYFGMCNMPVLERMDRPLWFTVVSWRVQMPLPGAASAEKHVVEAIL